MNIRKALRQSSLFSRVYYGLGIDNLLVFIGAGAYTKQCKNAIEKFEPGGVISR